MISGGYLQLNFSGSVYREIVSPLFFVIEDRENITPEVVLF